jgi:hypothetical protein
MKTSLKRNECTRQCRYNFTPDERLERGRQLADEYQTLDTTNQDLDRIKKDFKARIETHETRISTLAEQVRSGYELRETLCSWEYHQPVDGKKQLRRSDTMEIIETTDMTEADKQLVMEVVDAAAAAASAADGHPNVARAIPERSQVAEEDRAKNAPEEDSTPRRRASGPGVVEVDADDGQTGDDEDDRNKT